MESRISTLVAAAVFAGTPIASADVIWDTGAPNPVNFNGADTYLGYSSGNISANAPQRWAAVPFRIPTGGAIINQVDVDYFVQPGMEAKDVAYIIWKRTGLNAPVDGDQFQAGILGAYGPGADDPRVPATEDWLHQYGGLNIVLPEGDYYFTMYGDGIGAGNNTGFSNAPWLTGGDLQDEALEQDFMWRSEKVPGAGFQMYAPGNILPGAEMVDGQDRWNPSFAFHGEFIPAPGAAALLGLGGLIAARRRR